MRYLQRNAEGLVIAHFANEQSYAQEYVSDDHPDIREYNRRRAQLINPGVEVRVAGTMRRSPFARGLIRVLASKFSLTEEELLQLIIAAAPNTTASGELDG